MSNSIHLILFHLTNSIRLSNYLYFFCPLLPDKFSFYHLDIQAENSTLRGELENNKQITDSKLNQSINLKEMRKRLKELSHAVKTGKVFEVYDHMFFN